MSIRERRRVVVTGMGTISALGNDLDSFWTSIEGGKSAISELSLVDTGNLTCKIGGEVKDFNPEDYIEKKESRRMDRYTQFALAAARKAYDDAGIQSDLVDAERIGIAIGTGTGGISTLEDQLYKMLQRGNYRCNPFTVPMMLCNTAAGRIAIEFNARGPSITIVTACATGSDSIGAGMRMIQDDEADMVLAGSAEAPLTGIGLIGFISAQALSMRNDDPEKASRPFDVNRDGFVMAEGAGVLVLEEYNHAIARGARIYGEVAGYGRTADALDIVKPSMEGRGLAKAIHAALKDAGAGAEEIDYINAHATSTPVGDIAETNAIKSVFGKNMVENKLYISGTKSMTGHQLGAAGAIEAIITLMSLYKGTIPPTINLEEQDPECDLSMIPRVATNVANLTYALSNSAGFGGNNAALIFRRYG